MQLLYRALPVEEEEAYKINFIFSNYFFSFAWDYARQAYSKDPNLLEAKEIMDKLG